MYNTILFASIQVELVAQFFKKLMTPTIESGVSFCLIIFSMLVQTQITCDTLRDTT